MLDLRDKRVLITGATGFLGKAVFKNLRARGCLYLWGPSTRSWDMRSQRGCHKYFVDERPEIVIHLAAKCGGIGANMAAPAEFMADNLSMGLNVIAESKDCGAKLVLIGTVCSYPEFSWTSETTNWTQPPKMGLFDGKIRERDLWNGYPEPTNAPYGIAKRVLGEVLAAYHKQYGMRCAYVIPANLYGPGDNFDPETSHVIPAMIRRFTEAVRSGIEQVTCWGSGQPTRDFLYVEDAAEAIVRAAERIETSEPVNLGTGQETTMRGLAERIAGLCGYRGSIRWDKSRPDGQMRRVLDTTRQRERLEWMPAMGLEDGLKRTVEWWQAKEVEHAHA